MATDLRAAFPDMAGFSRSNLMYMRSFAAAWKRDEIVQAPLGQLPWYHQIALMERLKETYDLGLPPLPQLQERLSAALSDGKPGPASSSRTP